MGKRRSRPANGRAPSSPAPPLADWDAPGTLSVVVQGALFQGNMIEVANHCRHWRDLFPRAEIILVLSLSDVVTGTLHDGLFTSMRLVARHRHDGHLAAALDIIRASCDKVGMGESALPLPPIKSDSPKLNNMNLQLAAARHGLVLATGRYVLRIRSDLVFLDRSFIQQYEAGLRLPRGKAAAFEQRVLISWLYTLNPFTVERMPLHFSDWFHFGLTHDVRRLWAAPPITLADSLYYRTHPHRPHSNASERLFNIRLAVEQHVAYHCFAPSFPQLTLDYHNDRTSVELAMDILIDNFVVCDLVQARCMFEKYAHEFFDEGKRLHCITAECWAAMARDRTRDFGTLAEADWLAMARPAVMRGANPQDVRHANQDAFSRQREFPRTYGGDRLRTKVGRLVDGVIKGGGADGVLVHGPYVTLEPGSYLARVRATEVRGPGSVTLKVTGDTGSMLLAQKRLRTAQGDVEWCIPFHAPAEITDFEVVCAIKGLRSVAVSAVTVDRHVAAGGAKSRFARLVPWAR